MPKGSSWIPHDHHKVLLLERTGGQGKERGRNQGDIVGMIGATFAVGPGIGPQKGIITGMTWPNPVIRFPPKFADRSGRNINQS